MDFQALALHEKDKHSLDDEVDAIKLPNMVSQDLFDSNQIELFVMQLPNVNEIKEQINASTDGQINIKNATTSELDVTLILSIWMKDKYEVTKFILENTKSVQHQDSAGRNALHYACYLGKVETTQLLLSHGAKVNCWDNSRQVNPLIYAAYAGSTECIQLVIKHGAKKNELSRTNKNALHFAVDRNHVECVKLLLDLGMSPNVPIMFAEIPLHIAAKKGHTSCMELLLQNGSQSTALLTTDKVTPLHLSAYGNHLKCIKLLLNARAVVDARTADGRTPLHYACLGQSVGAMELLIDHGADFNATYSGNRTALHASVKKNCHAWECTESLLQRGVAINAADSFGYTALHIAAQLEYGDCVLLLLRKGANLNVRTNGNVSALKFITQKLPDVIKKYVDSFDSAITIESKHEIGDKDCEIVIDFHVLVPPNDEQMEMSLIEAFLDIGQKNILEHPLCEIFLYLKWLRFRKFFIASVMYHIVFVACFTSYILIAYTNEDQTKDLYILYYLKPHVMAVVIIALTLNSVLALKEIFQMCYGWQTYFSTWENFLQWLTIIGVYVSIYYDKIECTNIAIEDIPVWRFHFCAIVTFMVWLELMMIIGRFPTFGVYVQMFTTIAIDFMKFIGAYCCLILAFSLSFRILFSDKRSYSNSYRSLFKTIFMMVGEYNFEEIFYNQTNPEDNDSAVNYEITSHLMYIAFIFLVTIILINLLVGLAVSDIKGLRKSAKINRLTRQSKLISRLEGMIVSRIFKTKRYALLNKIYNWSRIANKNVVVRPNHMDGKNRILNVELTEALYKHVNEKVTKNSISEFSRYTSIMDDDYVMKDQQIRKSSTSGATCDLIVQILYRMEHTLDKLVEAKPSKTNTN